MPVKNVDTKKKKRKKRVKTGRAHDARTGKYVTKEFAAKRPGRVVAESKEA